MKYFKLNKVRRLIILGVTLVAAILSITLGSFLYVSKNPKKSIEYGGGAEFVVKINPENNSSSSKISDKMAAEVANTIYKRIDALGIGGAHVESEISSDGQRVRVTYPGITTQEQKDDLEKLITEKPTLTFTDIYGHPLFDELGNFNEKHLSLEQIKHSLTPIASASAPNTTQNGKRIVEINIMGIKVDEWKKASAYLSSLKSGQNRLFVWLNLDDMITELKGQYPKVWADSWNNPVTSIFIENKNQDPDWKPVQRKYTIDASKYLISDAIVDKVLYGSKFVIEGNFKLGEAKDLARQINYGAAHYSLKLEYSNYVGATYGADAFHKAMIAGLIVFSLIAVFLVVNYGLLGALSTISIALYVFITLAMFTVMRGEYSPEAIAALIIGVGMAVDANIITFERLKNEIYSGSSIKKGYFDANKKSISTIFDANITTLIVAFVLFFFGTRNIVGLSVTLILSIVLTLVVMLGFTRFTATLLVKTGMFDKKLGLLGMKPKFDVSIQEKINKYDYIKNAKWFTLGSALIFTAGIIVFAITAGIAGGFSGGFHLSQNFTGGTIIQLIPKGTAKNIDPQTYHVFETFLNSKGINSSDIVKTMSGTDILSAKFQSTDTFSDISSWKTEFFKLNINGVDFLQSITTTSVAKDILKNALIAIAVAISAIVVYTLIRFKWTYSVAAIVALLHDALIVIAFFVITRIEISPVFVAGLLSIIGYSINDTIVTFDRLRENMKLHEGEMSKEKIKEIANRSIKETLKRSILTSFTTIMAVVILMSFGNATKLAFNLAMLVGLIAGTYSSIFIATYLWTKLEIKRQQAVITRGEKNFWNTKGPEEQTFAGINDFTS